MRVSIPLTVLLGGTLLVAACGGSNDSGTVTSSGSAPTTSSTPVPTSASVRAIVTFDAVSRLERFPNNCTSVVAYLFSLDGTQLATQTQTRSPGQTTVTLSFDGLPPGQAVLRVLALDANGNTIGFEDVGVTLVVGQTSALTFDTLTPGTPPSGPGSAPASSPSPAPSPVASPTPGASPQVSPAASPSPSPGASPSPAGSPSPTAAPSPSPAAAPSSLSLVPSTGAIPAGGNLALTVGTSTTIRVIQTSPDGSTTDVTAQATLASSATGVVSVSPGGVVSALSSGPATVTATLGSLTGSLQVFALASNPGGFTPPATAPTPLALYMLGQGSGQNNLFTMPQSAPAQVLARTALTGLGAGETAVALTRRPSNGLYYLVTDDPSTVLPPRSLHIYTVDIGSGRASLVRNLTPTGLETALKGQSSPASGLGSPDDTVGASFEPVQDVLYLTLNNHDLVTLDASFAQSANIVMQGTTGTFYCGPCWTTLTGLVNSTPRGTTLFMYQFLSDNIVTVDATTGVRQGYGGDGLNTDANKRIYLARASSGTVFMTAMNLGVPGTVGLYTLSNLSTFGPTSVPQAVLVYSFQGLGVTSDVLISGDHPAPLGLAAP